MKRVYLIRHGESTMNALETHQDGTSLLSEKGLQQAEVVAARFKDTELDKIIASPMTRAKQTAEAIAKIKGLEIEFNDDIIEVGRPTAVVGLRYDHPEAKTIMDLINTNHHDPNFRHSDEENNFQGFERAQRFFKFLDELPDERILVVTHGEFLRLLIFNVLFGNEFDPKIYQHLRHGLGTSNTGVTVLEHKNNRWQMMTWNDYSHLP